MVSIHLEAVAAGSEQSPGRRLVVPFSALAVVGAGLTYLHQINPYEPGHYPVCPTLALAGIYCPGCGSLRAMHDLTHLDLVGALGRNPLVPVAFVALVALWFLWTWASWNGKRVTWQPGRWTPVVVGLLVVVFMVARNLPGMEFLSPA